ncbi:MAG TPA: SPFH domain-containing protein [Chthoniobacteraceae bacterium]|nr:SPFH domain-containing protein [Chthoniobacteraceae bacterium]
MTHRFTFTAGAIALLALAAAWLGWQWFFCRFYVPPGQLAIVIAKNGDPLPPGEILAREGQRGVQERVLAEGRHFLNPVAYEYKLYPATHIPAGKVGVVTSKVGKELPPGEFIAKAGEKGIWGSVLGPGKYRLNPVGYEINIVDAISVPIGYVGVVTSLSGKQAPEGEFAKTGQKGVRAEVLQPGLYYVNPRQFQVDVVEVGINQVALFGKTGSGVITKSQIATSNEAITGLQDNLLAEQRARRALYMKDPGSVVAPPPASAPKATPAPKGKSRRPAASEPEAAAAPPESKLQAEPAFILNQFVEFPSRDGFEISLDMTVEFELLPENIAWIFRNYGDLPATVEKVIMPQILSISRLKGSAYGARDFIVGEGREKFQNDMTETLARTLAEKKIIINNALIRHVNVPMQILSPIQQASTAQEQDLTNQEKQNTAKKQAELNTETSLIDQRRQQVTQETEKLKAGILADQSKQVAEIGAETVRRVAEIDKETAAVQAEKITTLGKAEADVIRLVQGERAKGDQLKIKAFGDPSAYNLYILAQSLSEQLKVNILHSGAGTLWTDLEKSGFGEVGGARLLQQSQKPAKGPAPKPAVP